MSLLRRRAPVEPGPPNQEVKSLDPLETLWQQILDGATFQQQPVHSRITLLNNAASSFLQRYWQTGQIKDLDQALSLWDQALTLAPAKPASLPSTLMNLGMGLIDRYGRTGRLSDLEEAIRLYQRAIALMPPNAPGLPPMLNNLGAALRAHTLRVHNTDFLEQALHAYEMAVACTPEESPDLPSMLGNLGTALYDRYVKHGRRLDLQEAMQAFQRAISLLPDNAPARSALLEGLGAALWRRYTLDKQPADLDEAIQYYQAAGAAVAPSRLLGRLALALRDRYVRQGAQTDLTEATALFRAACQRGQEMVPEETMRYALDWGSWASERGAWEEAHEAFHYGVAAIGRCRRTHLVLGEDESWFAKAHQLYACAAYALAKLNRSREALILLANGAARLPGEPFANDRATLETARQQKPFLVERYQQSAAWLNAVGRAELDDLPFDRYAEAEAAQEALDEIIHQIRELTGDEQFLRELDFYQLTSLTLPDQPLAFLATTPHGSLLLIAQEGLEVNGVKIRTLWSQAPAADEAPWITGPLEAATVERWLSSGNWTGDIAGYGTWWGSIKRATSGLRHSLNSITGPLR